MKTGRIWDEKLRLDPGDILTVQYVEDVLKRPGREQVGLGAK